MISYLSGICAEVAIDKAVIDVNGVGFEVFISAACAEAMPGIGEAVTLYTYFSVREDAMALYGFLSREELHLFRQLIGVNGVGPKMALGVFSALSADDLRFAIVTGDAKAIVRAPGIGKKIAERIVLELRDRLSAEDLLPAAGGMDASSSDTASAGTEEAAEALVALGYSASDALRAVRNARKNMPDTEETDTETLLKAALKELI
ncbi:MAG: Holliday junction branch migration protein RuvA [Lachnospiraceae bacterium]|nr:Holliday junction branch migration protein RuvA [Lachnospiraceae bacterium]